MHIISSLIPKSKNDATRQEAIKMPSNAPACAPEASLPYSLRVFYMLPPQDSASQLPSRFSTLFDSICSTEHMIKYEWSISSSVIFSAPVRAFNNRHKGKLHHVAVRSKIKKFLIPKENRLAGGKKQEKPQKELLLNSKTFNFCRKPFVNFFNSLSHSCDET